MSQILRELINHIQVPTTHILYIHTDSEGMPSIRLARNKQNAIVQVILALYSKTTTLLTTNISDTTITIDLADPNAINLIQELVITAIDNQKKDEENNAPMRGYWTHSGWTG